MHQQEDCKGASTHVVRLPLGQDAQQGTGGGAVNKKGVNSDSLNLGGGVGGRGPARGTRHVPTATPIPPGT